MSETNEKDLGAIPPDPIYQKSYAVPIAIASVALVGSVALAVADEMFFRRPYKPVQAMQRDVMIAFLDQRADQIRALELANRLADEYVELNAAVLAAEKDVAAERTELNTRFALLDAEGLGVSAALKDPNALISALTYDIEHIAHHDGGEAATLPSTEALRKRIDDIRAGKIEYRWNHPVEGRKTGEDTVGNLQKKFLAIVDEKGQIQARLGKLMAPVGAAAKARDEWIKAKMRDLASIADMEARVPNAIPDSAVLPADLEAEDHMGLSDQEKQYWRKKHFLEAFEKAKGSLQSKLKEVGAERYLRDYAVKLDPTALRSLHDRYVNLPTDPVRSGDIRQIHVKDMANWVDRCETCHVGTREPLPITKDSLREALKSAGWNDTKIDEYPLDLFTTHPRAEELFAHHDPEKVGCSTCHNGNGIAVTSVTAAHGYNKHWLWPLHPKENLESGCLQCHQQDFVLASGPRFSQARETFLEKGCWGCHAYQGHDPEPQAINKLQSRMRDIETEIGAKETETRQLGGLRADYEAARPEATQSLLVRQDALRSQVAALKLEFRDAARSVAQRYQERQRVGPNLKDLRVKLRPEVLFDWVKDPTSVRLDTKMPVFRWASDEEVKDVVAYLWQSSLTPKDFPGYALPAVRGGDATNGRQLFMDRGCLSCHAIEDPATKQLVGGDRAANLTNLGDKNLPEHVFRWIKNPRKRLTPWSVRLNDDITAEQAATEDPNTVVWTQHTVMPDFRLSDDEARDITAFLTSQKTGRFTQTPDWIEDKARFERGKKLVQYQGCAGCHEIDGLEAEKGIGRELTTEGSQPLDRLDFGHVTLDAKAGKDPLADWTTQKDGAKLFGDGNPWYRPRGFFMHKLAKPDVYDLSKFLPDRFTRLRMPQFRWSAQEIHDLTSFLLGSVVSTVPQGSRYNPDTRGQAIREGWWVIKKYNCQGCHPIVPGDVPSFAKLPWFSEVRARGDDDMALPPSLVVAGARMQPEYIAAFLRDPSLGGGTANPVSTRAHLKVRMPTYHLSDDEIAKLVRFFEALNRQPAVYQAEELKPLTEAERKIAEAIVYDSKAGNCFSCHPAQGKDGSRVLGADTKAPDLKYASEKLRTHWLRPWLQNPPAILPRTKMLKLFDYDATQRRWTYTNPSAPATQGYDGDYVDLLMRYLVLEYPKAAGRR